MKRLFYLLLLLPFLAVAQSSTGQEQEFDYGIKNNASQTVSNPIYLTTTGTDGTQGKVISSEISYNDTGIKSFAGLTTNSSTTINIGAVSGYVVDNETNPSQPVKIAVSYAGATGVTVTTVGSGIGSYVMLSSAGVVSFQNTFPTSAERKAKILLGKVGHPTGTITTVGNEPDFITSPLAQYRDLAQAFGYVNNGVSPYANGANLNMNITQGAIFGDGINFVSSNTNPNYVTMGPNVTAQFFIRTQTGGATGLVTAITPGVYDVSGTITSVGGGSGSSTLQYIYAVPPLGYIVQLGQTVYPSLNDAISAVGKEAPVVYPNLINNAILIGVLAVNKSATTLNNTAQAQFFTADKLGQLIGSSAGTSTATMQTAYNNSTIPQIVTSTLLGAVTHRRGSSADTDIVYQVQNGAGTTTYSVDGNGNNTSNSFIKTGGTVNQFLMANGSVLEKASVSNVASGTTSGTTETILYSKQLLSGDYVAGNTMRITVLAEKTTSATETGALRVYFNTVNSLSGAMLIAGTTGIVPANTIASLLRHINFRSGNIIEGLSPTASTTSDIGTGAFGRGTSSFNYSSGFYVIVTGQVSNAAINMSTQLNLIEKL